MGGGTQTRGREGGKGAAAAAALTGSSKTRSSTSGRRARMRAREMAMRCHWTGTRRFRIGFTVLPRVLEKTQTYLPAGESVELVGRGAVAERVGAAAELVAVQSCTGPVGQ